MTGFLMSQTEKLVLAVAGVTGFFVACGAAYSITPAAAALVAGSFLWTAALARRFGRYEG